MSLLVQHGIEIRPRLKAVPKGLPSVSPEGRGSEGMANYGRR